MQHDLVRNLLLSITRMKPQKAKVLNLPGPNRCKHFTKQIIIWLNKVLQRENYVTSLSNGKEQNHHNGFLATLKQSGNCNKKTKRMLPQKHWEILILIININSKSLHYKRIFLTLTARNSGFNILSVSWQKSTLLNNVFTIAQGEG